MKNQPRTRETNKITIKNLAIVQGQLHKTMSANKTNFEMEMNVEFVNAANVNLFEIMIEKSKEINSEYTFEIKHVSETIIKTSVSTYEEYNEIASKSAICGAKMSATLSMEFFMKKLNQDYQTHIKRQENGKKLADKRKENKKSDLVTTATDNETAA